ncbi:glycosyltransferase family 2 protein [Halobacteria archaeon AArc-dxtr1]|nr:glycosyltransferase family 2 protein [Halobacteria archaeon AArc-dxtr1]
MKLSVVVSTLNGRERLLDCLDALAAATPPSAEVIVVNGPSSDGTTGAVRDRDDVDVLVEISERNRNVSRNAGLETVTGSVVAFLDDRTVVDDGWYAALDAAMCAGADVVTGPVSGDAATNLRSRTVGGRAVTEFDGDNVAFDRTVLDALDGFDESVETGGAVDAAHRIADLGFDVVSDPGMRVRRQTNLDPGWGPRYRSLSYRLTKNYGPRPTITARIVGSALRDAAGAAKAVATGESTPTGWLGNGLAVTTNAAKGYADGLRARYADRTTRRNPNGVSARHDRAVRLYDRR